MTLTPEQLERIFRWLTTIFALIYAVETFGRIILLWTGGNHDY